jgi:hypothetical protein
MTVLSTARYRTLTGDNDTNDTVVAARIAEAEELLTEALCRPLEYATRTERCYLDRAGWAWPQARPIASVVGYLPDGHGVPNVARSADDILRDTCADYADLTYTGGWDAADAASPHTGHKIPATVEADLAACAQWIGGRAARLAAAVDSPDGATSVRVGDVAVSYGPGGAPSPGDSYQWSRATLRHRYRGSAG